MSAEPLWLQPFSHSTFPATISSSSLVASSPTLDLAAIVTNANTSLTILRAHGEIVSVVTERGLKVQALCWKSDGRLLAVAWDDGTVRLLSLENYKVVHHVKVPSWNAADAKTHPEPITHIAWTRNLTRGRHVGKSNSNIDPKLQSLGIPSPTYYGLGLDEATGLRADDLVDLPHALTFLEIDSSLPKISPLPMSGGTGDDMFVFSTTASLESMFAPLNAQDKEVIDVMVVGTRDGHVHLSIYDSFSIGSFKIPIKHGPGPATFRIDGTYELYRHASHPEASTHSLLLRNSGAGDPTCLYLVPMDLRFVSHSPVNLSLLASKTTTLQKLLRYVKQTQVHIINEWRSTRDLPSRILSSIEEELQKMGSGPANIVQALYHTVLTGHVHPPVRAWLVDSIAERGHERWEKTVIPGLENLRNLIHENMLPAIERCTLILSRLSGIARFHEEDHIGFADADINRIFDMVSALNLVCHKVLLIVMEELELFRIFSSWLRVTIDRISSPTVVEEILEREALFDPAKILRYIERYLLGSPMAVYFSMAPHEILDEGWNRMQDCSAVMEKLDEQLKLQEEGKPYIRALPQMAFLIDFLTEKAGDIFRNIAEAEKRNVRFGQVVRLALAEGESRPETLRAADVKMCSVLKPNSVDGITYTAVVSNERPSKIGIFETRTEIINGISSAPSTTLRYISSSDADMESQVLDVKFLNERVLLAMCQSKDVQQFHLLHILFRPVDSQPGQVDPSETFSSYRSASSSIRRIEFPDDLGSFVPCRMEVMEGNHSRGSIPARVCLVAEDGVGYQAFALPQYVPMDDDAAAAATSASASTPSTPESVL